MLAAARHNLRSRIQRWVDRRQPEVDCERLNQRNLYILPARDGLYFLLLVAMIWVMGTNYENNLILLLAFFLMAVFVSSIFHTHANLSGLEIRAGDIDPVFAGEDLKVPVELYNPTAKRRQRIGLGWQAGELHLVDIPPQNRILTELNLPTARRGRLRIDRLHIETRAPLGLLRAWSQPLLRADCVIYPHPLERPVSADGSGEGGAQQSAGPGTDDFGGLEPWQPGVPMQRIAWKQYSAGLGLLEKRFEAQSHNPRWLDWDDYAGLDVESRLSALCAKALEMEKLGRSYGLRIPSALIAPGLGERHLRQVLTALALYPEPHEY